MNDRGGISRRSLLLTGAGLAVAPTAGSLLTAPASAAAGDTVWTVGLNTDGQLGDGTFTSRTSLLAVANGGLLDVDEIHGGREHVLARRGGLVFTWGNGLMGALGSGTVTDRNTPGQVAGLSGVTAVSSGHYASYAVLPNGTVRSWGDNPFGQLGDGTTTRRTSPVTVRLPSGAALTGVRRAAGGRDMAAALLTGGTVMTWGRGADGELGNGTTQAVQPTPVAVPDLSAVTALACGRNHVLALRSDGTVRAWGRNDFGQVGDGTLVNRTSPVPVPGLSGVVAVAAGAEHSVAVTSAGQVYTWGRSNRGQLGLGITTVRSSPQPVRGVSAVTGAGCGRDHTIVWTAAGTAWWWGWNLNGQLGAPAGGNRLSPVSVPLTRVRSAYGGHGYTVLQRRPA
jgi:alpha-tubulin suppressor-like RCC1 family protein